MDIQNLTKVICNKSFAFVVKLLHYQIFSGNANEKSSVFNVASAGAMSRDTVHQAKNLVKRMRSDRHVDMKNHWKLVS